MRYSPHSFKPYTLKMCLALKESFLLFLLLLKVIILKTQRSNLIFFKYNISLNFVNKKHLFLCLTFIKVACNCNSGRQKSFISIIDRNRQKFIGLLTFFNLMTFQEVNSSHVLLLMQKDGQDLQVIET